MATNPSAALVKAPKLFWTDCGLAAWLAGIKSSADATQRLDAGFGWSKPCFRLWTRGVPSIHNGASCIFGGIVRGTKWISFWKRPASW
jgi:hypothetical protein